MYIWNRRYVNINCIAVANGKLNVDFEDIAHPSKTYETVMANKSTNVKTIKGIAYHSRSHGLTTGVWWGCRCSSF